MSNNEVRIQDDEIEVISKQWQREYGLSQEKSFPDKNEGVANAVLVTIIIGFVTFVLAQLYLPYIDQFFKHISQLSIGI